MCLSGEGTPIVLKWRGNRICWPTRIEWGMALLSPVQSMRAKGLAILESRIEMTTAAKRLVIAFLGPDPQPTIKSLHHLKPDETWVVTEARLAASSYFTHTIRPSLDACIGKYQILTLDDPLEILSVKEIILSKIKDIFNSHADEDIEVLVSLGSEPHPTSIAAYECVKHLRETEKKKNLDICLLAEDKLIYIFKGGGVENSFSL